MCPGSHCYFDYYQADPEFQPEAIGGLTTVKKVYSFSPVPSELTVEESKLILGGQGNLWTEYISTASQAEYMASTANDGIGRSALEPGRPARDWDDFQARMQTQFSRFERMKVNYLRRFRES